MTYRASAGVVDVVVLERDQVAGSGEVHAPVVVPVAGGRPIGLAVDLAVGDGDAVGGALAQDDVLAADARGLDVVDPDEVGAVDGDTVAAPDVLGVDLGNMDVLDDDVLSATDDAKPLAVDDGLRSRAHQRLV